MLRPWIFLLINGLVVLYLVVRLLSNSKRDRPTSMKMGLDKDSKGLEPENHTFKNAGFSPNEKSLNCWFQYNGETWDAFEVLGVPFGASQEMCHRAYIDIKRRDPSAGPFLDAAWRALQDHFKVS